MSKPVPITVANGDGIGPEIMAATLEILKGAGANLEIETIDIGEKVYLAGNSSGIEASSWDSLRRTKVFLKAPITTPQGGGFKSLNVTVRKTLGLYANVRPCVSYDPFVKTKHPQMDVVIEPVPKVRLATRKQAVGPQVKVGPNESLLVVRVIVTRSAGDAKDGLMRFSPGSIRLVGNKSAGGQDAAPTNYFPIGTVEGGKTVLANKLDDFLFIDTKEPSGVDLAFVVETKSVFTTGADGTSKIAPGVFVEINRLAREDLSGRSVKSAAEFKPSAEVKVKRKEDPNAKKV